MDKIELAQDRTLKKTRKIKVGEKGNKQVLSAEWMDARARVYIRERKIKNKAWRYARRKKAPQQDIENLKKKLRKTISNHI